MKSSPVRVLLIDGDSEAAIDLRNKLTDVKNVTFRVDIACTEAEGMRLLEKKHYDALLIDFGVTGTDVIPKLRDLQSRVGEIPILVTSGTYEDSNAFETVRAGAQDYLVKNRLNSAALERILVHCIERQRGRSRTAMQYQISRALAESESSSDAIIEILRLLCDFLEYDFGQSWSFDHWSAELILGETWHRSAEKYAKFESESREFRFDRGSGLPGRTWMEFGTVWIPDICQDQSLKNAECAAEAGLRSALAFPITLGPEFLGSVELFSTEPREPDDELRKIVTNIGSQIGQFLARKRAEEQKERAAEERLLILDSASEGIYGVDLSGCITFMNRAAARMFRCNPADVNGKNSHELFHHTRPDGSPYLLKDCPIKTVFRVGEGVHSDEEYFWRTDGTHLAVDYSVFPVSEMGSIKGAVICFNDVSDRKRLEVELRQAQKLEAVGGLAAGIAHEINTPIQFVGDNTRFLQDAFRDEVELIEKYEDAFEQLQQGPPGPVLLANVRAFREKIDWEYLRLEIPKAMDQMLDGIGRVATIVRAMKEFSHVDRSSEKSAADLNKALESTLTVARAELKYVADVEEDFGELPPVICHLGDLNQVFLNLLINAAHAIADVMTETSRKGTISVRTRRDGDSVDISISDTGTGIPEQAREKIFNPFFTTKEVGKGTGQGLTLARAVVVEKHGGTLTFETEVGKGTTFHVRLPINGVRETREVVTK